MTLVGLYIWLSKPISTIKHRISHCQNTRNVVTKMQKDVALPLNIELVGAMDRIVGLESLETLYSRCHVLQ